MATKRKRSEKKDKAPPAKKQAINKVAADYPVRHGERGCERKGCSNGAYWLVGREHLCGVHSKKYAVSRLALRPMSKEDKAKKQRAEADAHAATVAAARFTDGKAGQVRMQRLMGQRKIPKPVPGFKSIAPNFYHGNVTWATGMPKLSPMSLGPVKHGLPDGQNIENVHQLAGKCWKEECVPSETPLPIQYLGAETSTRRPVYMLRPGPVYEKARVAGLENKIPQRHKFKSSDHPENGNVPICFVWRDKDKIEHYLSYVNSRQFYCTFYSRLARETAEFKQLVEWRAQGIHLNLIGYDAYDMEPTRQGIHAAYLSDAAPFGHERVLLAMLVLKESDWPWVVYKSFDF